MATSVDTLIFNAQQYAGLMAESVDIEIQQAQQFTQAVLDEATPQFDAPSLGAALDTPDVPPAPQLNPVTLGNSTIAIEPAPQYADLPEFSYLAPPQDTTAVPTINLPSRPAAFFGEAPGPAPSISTDVQIPEPPPQLVNPVFVEPTTVDREAPDAPVLQMPSFAGQRPDAVPDAPGDLPGVLATAYQGVAQTMPAALKSRFDAQLQEWGIPAKLLAVEGQLARYLQGGTALAPAVESAIYERARDKSNAEYRRTRDTAWSDAAKRGFTLPSGALHSAVLTARQGAADNQARAGVEIAVAQAEMEQKNLQFAVSTSASLISALMGSAVSFHQSMVTVNGQALEYGKSVLGAIIEAYNISVRKYASQLDLFRADIALYEARLREVTTRIEIFRAEVDVMRAQIDADKAKIDIYVAKINSLQALAAAYRARVDAVVSKAGLERNKIDLFRAQIDAYTAQIQAKNSEFQGYAAAVSGEEAKARVYATQVGAFGTKVEAYKAQVSAEAASVRAAADFNQAKSSHFEASVRAYSAEKNALVATMQANGDLEKQKVLNFQVLTNLAETRYQSNITYYKMKYDIDMTRAVKNFEGQMAAFGTAVEKAKIFAQLQTELTQTYGKVAGAALAGINTLVSQESQA